MRHIDESEKPGREAALKKVLGLMAGMTGKRLAGMKKKPYVTVTEVDAHPLHSEGGEPDDGDGDEGGDCPTCGKPY